MIRALLLVRLWLAARGVRRPCRIHLVGGWHVRREPEP